MKKITTFILILCFLLSSISVSAYQIKYYEPVDNVNLKLPEPARMKIENGNMVCEGENIEYGKDAKVIEDPNASGGLAITPSVSGFQPDATQIKDVTMKLTVDVPLTERGIYNLWVRIKNTDSYFHQYTGGSANYTERWFGNKLSSTYEWIKLYGGGITTDTFEYNIKYRDTGFVIDKFIFTNDSNFTPVEMDDLPNALLGIAPEALYPIPEIAPPANKHPRLLVTEELIPQIRENSKHPLLKSVYEQIKIRGMQEMDCHMPDKGSSNNFSMTHLFNIQCRAYLYLIGDVDKEHARQTVRHMLDMYETLVWDTKVGDITRSIGSTLAASGIVYDWCYDVLTEEEKSMFIAYMKKSASLMEIGYPPKVWEVFAGHGGEGEVFYFQLAAGIAIYDEDPEMYNLAAGMMFQNMFDSRKYFNATGNHPAGSAYAPVRVAWEQLGQILFDRMGYPGVMGNEMDKIPMRWIHDRLPSGFWTEDGDSFLQFSKDFGPYYSTNDYPMMLYGAYFGNKYEQGEYIKQLSLRNYSPGASVYDNGVLTMVLLDPNAEYAYPDDEGEELALTHTTTYPLTSMFMRTSWLTGKESDTAVVFMNGQEKLVGDHDHEHSDIGNFQIYYKGTLAGHGGTYQGKEGGYGTSHYNNYYRRTISKNCLTVFDPNEVFMKRGKPVDVSNDGGQIFEQNTTLLKEFLEHEDHAATEGVYVGPNERTPEFSYLKTNLTDAYSDKVSGYTRSMVAMNLFNDDYPMAFICYDNVTSSDKTFKKTWNLQAVQEPEINGNQIVIKRDDYDFSGKLVVNKMLPENAIIQNVGGEGFESYVNGKNYPNADTGTNDNEQCDWRLEISPKNLTRDDLFLNAMYVTDSSRNLPDLPMYKEDFGMFLGVTVMDRTVLFSKTRKALANGFNISVRDNGYSTMSVLVTDVSAGKWNITGNGINIVYEVKEGENAIYAKLAPGSYSVSKAAEEAEVTTIEYPENENIGRVGDYMIYDITARNFIYNRKPTVLKDNQPYIASEDIIAKGATITPNGAGYVLKNLNYEAVITPGSVNAVFNQIPTILKSAPFVSEDGTLYINPLDIPQILGYNVSYDDKVRILKISKRASAAAFGDAVDVGKIVEPVSYYASSSDGNDPVNLFDYSYKTRWSADGTSEYLVMDFGRRVEVDKLMMAFLEGNLRSTKFEILVSDDGVNYTEVYAGQSSGTTLELEEFPVNAPARFIKLSCHGNTLNTWNSITEVITLVE